MNKLFDLGIHPKIGMSFSPLSDDEILRCEMKVGGRFPEDYREFLRQFADCDFDVYCEFPTAGGGVAPGFFFGRNLEEAIDIYGERLPQKFIPVNSDGAENLFCISLRDDSFGEVFFQSHSIGWDDADENADIGKLGTTFWLAKAFSEFILGLVPV